MMISSKLGGNFECCMCGDCGLSYELFRCKVCQFRSQHRYCSNLYPNAQSYRVCNWCLIQKEENHHHHQSTNSSSNNSSNNSSSPALKTPTSTTSTSQHYHQHQDHQNNNNNNNPFAVKKKNTRKSSLLYDSNINDHNSNNNNSGTKNNIYKLRPPGSPIKKPKYPDAATATGLSSPSSHRARRPNANCTTLINGGQTHEGLKRTIIRRTKSDEMSNNKAKANGNGNGNLTPNSNTSTVGTTRPHVFRNKVRRYKLLEEVSS